MESCSEAKVPILLSCTPGLEKLCENEVQEKLKTEAWKESRGRVTTICPFARLEKLSDLRSVYHYYAVAFNEELDYLEGEEKESILGKLETLATNATWDNALVAWKLVRRLQTTHLNDIGAKRSKDVSEIKDHGAGDPKSVVTDPSLCNNLRDSTGYQESNIVERILPTDSNSKELRNIKFRVTTNRVGKHCITSPDASRFLGSGVKEKFGWDVDLENYDINVQAYVNGPKLILSLQLTSHSLHKRNLSHFGPTSLIPTISYCIIKLANPQIGDVICDPMCGGGSICLEGVHSFQQAFHLGGEIHPEGCLRSQANFEAYSGNQQGSVDLKASVPCNVCQWDTCNMPIRTGSVDIIVCDLPFGRKIGHRTKNWSLYTCALREAARICRCAEGRAVLLTHHKEAFNRALKFCHHLWKRKSIYHVSMGGLNVGVYVLGRTTAMPKTDEKPPNVKKRKQNSTEASQ